jgi:hypothetical protein
MCFKKCNATYETPCIFPVTHDLSLAVPFLQPACMPLTLVSFVLSLSFSGTCQVNLSNSTAAAELHILFLHELDRQTGNSLREDAGLLL